MKGGPRRASHGPPFSAHASAQAFGLPSVPEVEVCHLEGVPPAAFVGVFAGRLDASFGLGVEDSCCLQLGHQCVELGLHRRGPGQGVRQLGLCDAQEGGERAGVLLVDDVLDQDEADFGLTVTVFPLMERLALFRS